MNDIITSPIMATKQKSLDLKSAYVLQVPFFLLKLAKNIVRFLLARLANTTA